MAQLISLSKEKNKRNNAFDNLRILTQDEIKKVNELLVSKLEKDIPLIPKIANHLIKAGGKRLRPMLAIACAKMCGYQGNRHINLAACVEMLHTATLLHDDVVDESSFRRGLKSANFLWGNKQSILVGDFLLSRSFEIMVEDKDLKILEILSNSACVISKGEVMQLSAISDIRTNEEKYLEIIKAKTSKLFASSCQIGAVIAGLDEQKQEALKVYGTNLGTAFQLVDDVLDYSSNLSTIGKNKGDDFFEGKITLPLILTYNRGNKEQKNFLHKTLKAKQRTKQDLKTATKYIQEHKSLDDCMKRANHYKNIAKDALGVFPNSKEKQILLDIVDFCVNRAY